jgi:hypothetical protein
MVLGTELESLLTSCSRASITSGLTGRGAAAICARTSTSTASITNRNLSRRAASSASRNFASARSRLHWSIPVALCCSLQGD